MPEYNPAIAAQVQPAAPNLAPTINSLSQLNEMQARTGLLNLQTLQQQRQYNALQAASQAYREGHDPTASYLGAGGDPAGANSLQNLFATQRAMAQTPGYIKPQDYEAGTGALRNVAEVGKIGVETTNARAQTPGLVAQSNQRQTEADAAAAKQYGPAILLNPKDDGAWAQLVNAHFNAVGGTPLEHQAALNIKDPNMRVDGAIRYGAAAGVPVQELAKTFNVNQPGQQTAQGQAQPAVGLKQPGEVKQAEEQAGYFSKLYSGISALGNTSASSLEDIRLAKAAINDPNFWSGTGETYNMMYKRALALGGDTSALPQEVFRKVMAANVLQQTNGMKAAAEEMGAGSSRLFQSQIELMQKAAQNPDNTIAANRFLTEVAERAANKNITLANSAADYKNGKLDPQFEKQFRGDVGAPMFSNWELGHLNTIGAPMADKVKQIDPREIQHLRDNPKNAAQFDKYYGPGTSKAVLNQ